MSNFSSLKAAIQQYIKTNGNEEITGAVLQDILLSMVSVLGDTAINDLETALQTETTNRTNADGTLQQNITAEGNARQQADVALGGRIDGLQSTVQSISTMLGEGYMYAGLATTSTNPGTPTGKVFYIATAAGTYTNFSGVVLTQGINILKYNGSVWSSEQVTGIDVVPTVGSDNLVKSGGVAKDIINLQYNFETIEIKGNSYGYKILNNLSKGKTYSFTNKGNASCQIILMDESSQVIKIIASELGQNQTVVATIDVDAYYLRFYSASDVNCEISLVDSIESFMPDIKKVKGINIDVGIRLNGYLDGLGAISTANNFYHYTVAVEKGKWYDVHTILGTPTVYIGGTDTQNSQNDITLYLRDSVNCGSFTKYRIKAIHDYLIVSYMSGTVSDIPQVSQVGTNDKSESSYDKLPIEIYTGGWNLGVSDGFFVPNVVKAFWLASKIEGKKRIHIANGTYDILQGLGGMNYINSKSINTDTEESVNPFMHDVEIIGYGNVVLNFILEPTDYEHYWLFACLNFNGNASVENITINAQNCRYAIHDESGGLDRRPNTKRLYRNMIVNGNNKRCLGCGYSNNTSVELENCILNTLSNTGAYTCHAASGVNVVFKNCIISNENELSIRISQENEANNIQASIINCFMHELQLSPEHEGAISGQTEVSIINTKTDVDNRYSSYSKHVTEYNTILGTKNIII